MNGLGLHTPNIRRSKKPEVHKIYSKNGYALEVRARKASTLVNLAYEQLPWLRPEHRPLVSRWAELQVIIQCAFAGICQNGMFRVDEKAGEVSVKRLVHDYRQLVQTQAQIAAALLMTPASAAQLSGQQPTDLVGLMAAAASAETVEPAAEPVEPEPVEPEKPTET